MTPKKKKSSIALKKASTSLKNVIEMIERDEYCIDIIQQNLAVMGLLKSAHQTLMENHLETCFKKALEEQDGKSQEMIDEIMKIAKLASKFTCNWALNAESIKKNQS